MKFEVTIMGCSSAAPTKNRNLTAQVLNSDDQLFLIDCGEATQMQFIKYHIKYSRINRIFISHLHGDHYLGLVPLLFSYHLFGRTKSLHVYANAALEEIIHLQLKASDSALGYPLIFHPLAENKSEMLYDDDKLSIISFPLKHGVPTHGFVFRQTNAQLNLDTTKIKGLNLTHEQLQTLKQGSDVIAENGQLITYKSITLPQESPKIYAFCTDTAYSLSVVHFVKDADLLYHEATFMHHMLKSAEEKHHSTTLQAGEIAKRARVKRLLIGHYSARYDDLRPLLNETATVFPNVELAEEGKTFII
jgi:ribonuclease Z